MRIIVVGGGAGGLELATKLGNTIGRKGHAEVILVDKNTSHVWKPLLHEVATGSLDGGVDALSYMAHAKNHHFSFQLGSLSEINRDQKTITLAKICDEHDELLSPSRTLNYDILVLALGSLSNDFNTPGVKEHCIFLDQVMQADRFRKSMNDQFLKLNANQGEGAVNIAIVGAGATGVELSAELHHAVKALHYYGLDELDSSKLNVHLIEAGERILPALPERISAAAEKELVKLGVQVHTKTMIVQAEKSALLTKEGKKIEAQIMVWAAGIKAPDFMKNIAGLETNKINQLVVKPTLQTSLDDDIFVIGDLASCRQADGSFVPPRAQAAHQMASCAFKNIVAKINHKSLKDYHYKDHGSLVSLSKFSTVGSLMGNLSKGSMMIEGKIARFVYISLYRLHLVALHGCFKTGLMVLVGRINRVLRPNLKLH